MKLSTNTIVRNGVDFVELCLVSVLPYSSESLVYVDSRSNDGTYDKLLALRNQYPQLVVERDSVSDPVWDLVEMRNKQLKRSTGDWILILDSDEYYPKESIEGLIQTVETHPNHLFFSPFVWSIWTMVEAHRASSSRPALRLVRNLPDLKWQGLFGGEKLVFQGKDIAWKQGRYMGIPEHFKCSDIHYVHFTHWKSDNWREELNQHRISGGKFVLKMPDVIINELIALDKKYGFKEKSLPLVQGE